MWEGRFYFARVQKKWEGKKKKEKRKKALVKKKRKVGHEKTRKGD